MIECIPLLVVVAAFMVYQELAHRRALDPLLEEIVYLRLQKETAEDRLFGAWKDGAAIPARPEPPPPQFEEIPIPEMLTEWVERWESPEARAREAEKIRNMLLRGMTQQQIFIEYEKANGPNF